MSQPLKGVRVLDLTRLLPGGICTMMLADMGADVIKVESPDNGDYARWMPPLIDGQGAYFRTTNRNKRSTIINLKSELGVGVLHQLTRSADVLIESYRPGVMERLRCDYETLQAVNPRLIYCSLSGWGQNGPYAQRSGHDLNYLAVSGLIGEMNQPQPPGGQIADIGGAYSATAGIVAALYGREKTGAGSYLDLSLFESALPFFASSWIESVVDSETRGRLSGRYACYNVYQAHDGIYVSLGALEPQFWENFCMAIERPDLVEDYLAPDRQRYLLVELEQIFALMSAAEWFSLLDPADCCFALVNTAEDTASDPQIRARDALGVDAVPWIRSPIRLDGELPPLGTSPAFGEHTRAVLLEAGFSNTEIDVLIKSEAVGE